MKSRVKPTEFLPAIFVLLAIVLSAMPCVASDPGPSPEPPPVSSVQIMIATSIPKTDLTVERLREYRALKTGARISGGAFPMRDWHLTARPTDAQDSDQKCSLAFQSQQNSGSTVVVYGDFSLVKDDQPGGKMCLRACMERFAEDVGGPGLNGFVVVNGLPTQELSVSLDGAESVHLPPMSSHVFDSLPTNVQCEIKIGDQVERLPLEFVPPVSSVIVAFYQADGKTHYVAMPQRALRDY